MQFHYFAYGSNMNFDQMNNRCPGSIYVSSGMLKNWSYFINGNGYAGIEEKLDSFTLGCIWGLSDEHIASLDQYESVAEGYYKRVELDIINDLSGEEQKTIVYLSNNRQYGSPSVYYQKGVIEGARNVGLPEDYIKTLESWSSTFTTTNQD